jgi:hypothetical protein
MGLRTSAGLRATTDTKKNSTARRLPAAWALVLAALVDLQAVGGLLAVRSLTLSMPDESEQIGYLAERVRRHAQCAMRALEEQRPSADGD